jgi:hypothetical protein
MKRRKKALESSTKEISGSGGAEERVRKSKKASVSESVGN